VYQLASQLLASAQSVDDALARGAGHIRLPAILPMAVAARADLWHEVLALVALQHRQQVAEEQGTGGRDGMRTGLATLQDVATHVLDSKIVELVVEVLLTNTRAINITVGCQSRSSPHVLLIAFAFLLLLPLFLRACAVWCSMLRCSAFAALALLRPASTT
jgi:hypothetical protein